MSFEAFLKFLGRKVAMVRKSRFLTQKDAAQRAGMSYRHFQNIEIGSANVTLRTLFRLSELFGVHPSELVPKRPDVENIRS